MILYDGGALSINSSEAAVEIAGFLLALSMHNPAELHRGILLLRMGGEMGDDKNAETIMEAFEDIKTSVKTADEIVKDFFQIDDLTS